MGESIERATIDLTVNQAALGPRLQEAERALERFRAKSEGGGAGGGGGGGEGEGGEGGFDVKAFSHLKHAIHRVFIPALIAHEMVQIADHLDRAMADVITKRTEQMRAVGEIASRLAERHATPRTAQESERVKTAKEVADEIQKIEDDKNKKLLEFERRSIYDITKDAIVGAERDVDIVKNAEDDKARIRSAARTNELNAQREYEREKTKLTKQADARIAAAAAGGLEGQSKRLAEDAAARIKLEADLEGVLDVNERKRIRREYNASYAAKARERDIEDRGRVEASVDRRRATVEETTTDLIERARMEHAQKLEEIHRRIREHTSIEEYNALIEEQDAEEARWAAHQKRMADAAVRQHQEMLDRVQDAQTRAFGPNSVPLDMLATAGQLHILELMLPTMIRNMGGH